MSQQTEKIFLKTKSSEWQQDILILWHLSRPYVWRLVIAVVCGAVLSVINGAIAWFIKPALDSFFSERLSFFLLLMPIGVILLFLMRGAFTYLTNYLMSSVGAKIVTTLRKDIYDKLLVLPISFYTKTSSGSLVSKLLNDLGVLHATVAFTIRDFFVEGGTVVVLATVAIVRKWDLALLSFVVIPLMGYSIGRLGKTMKKTSMNTRKLISRVTTILHESLQGMKIIKAFTMEKEMSQRHENALTEHYRNTMREVRIDEFSRLITEALGGVGVALILFYGGQLVLSNRLSAGSFFSFIAAILMIYTPLKRLSKVYNNFQQARTVIERIQNILVVENERPGGVKKDIRGHILLDNVAFKYPSAKENALSNISLDIQQGEIVALVGYSGAGKSTLIDLLGGFWLPSEGSILIDGININELSLKSLRRHLGMVTQDIILFNDTVKANILFGRPEATDREIEEAAKAAFAHEFIMELPEAYKTRIGERGIMLSGGQKQRITIARAILRNPAILLLDEATSSLDSESEQKVQEAMERLMTGRTTIVIAHRLSTVTKASRIIVMSRGKIIQQGDHASLLLQGGLYQELYAMQFTNSELSSEGPA